MYRTLVALLVAAPILAAPGMKEKEPVLYFPIQEGAKRVMEVTYAGRPGSTEAAEIVTKVEAKDGTYRVTVEQDFNGQTFANVFEVSGKGITRVVTASRKVSEPRVLLKLPAKSGDTWTSGGSTFTTGTEEEVEVPAGKFKALVVVTETGRPGMSVKATGWFAAGVGLVKTVTTSNGSDTTYVLKSFTPGK